MSLLSTSGINQLPDPAVELIVEFSGDPFSMMALNSSMKGCVTQLFEGKACAKKIQQLGRILRPIVRQSMETQRESIFQKNFRRLHNYLRRLSPRFFGQEPTFSQREYVVRAMDEDRFDILALKISIDKISGGPEFLRKERGDFFIKVLVKSIEAYEDYFPQKRPDDPDRIEEWITGWGTSMQLKKEMQCVEEEHEQFLSISRRSRRRSPLILSWISLKLIPWILIVFTRRDHYPERLGDWRLLLYRDPMENNELKASRVRGCYVISSTISWIDCLSDSRRKIDLMRKLETKRVVSQRLLDPLDPTGCIINRWRLYMTKHLKETRNLSDQEKEWEWLGLENIRFEEMNLTVHRSQFWLGLFVCCHFVNTVTFLSIMAQAP